MIKRKLLFVVSSLLLLGACTATPTEPRPGNRVENGTEQDSTAKSTGGGGSMGSGG